MTQKGIFPIQRGTLSGVAILVTVAQVESDECAIALGEITGIYLFRGVVELMSIAFTMCQCNGAPRGSARLLS